MGANEASSAHLPECGWTDTGACATNSIWDVETLLEASTFGPRARFIAMGNQTVAIAVDAGEPQRVAVIQKGAAGSGKSFVMPSADWVVVDVSDTTSRPAKLTLYALACRETCSLWQIAEDMPDGSTLQEVAGSSLPDKPHGLAFDYVAQQPCVLGKGLRCFDAGWHEVIAPSDDNSELRELATGPQLSLALGEHGRYWTRKRGTSTWTSERADSEIAWLGANVAWYGERAYALGEHGALMTIRSDAKSTCSSDKDLIAVSAGYVVTKQGEVLAPNNNNEVCTQGQLNTQVLATSTTVCGASENPWWLTENTVLGVTTCIQLP